MSKRITAAELSRHNNASDCWVAIKGKVYDVTAFLYEHPGTALDPISPGSQSLTSPQAAMVSF